MMMAPNAPRNSHTSTPPGEAVVPNRWANLLKNVSMERAIPEPAGSVGMAAGPFMGGYGGGRRQHRMAILHRRIGLEQSQVLVLGVAVGHARQIIADHPLGRLLLSPPVVALGQ